MNLESVFFPLIQIIMKYFMTPKQIECR